MPSRFPNRHCDIYVAPTTKVTAAVKVEPGKPIMRWHWIRALGHGRCVASASTITLAA
jgi:hypothetical protein